MTTDVRHPPAWFCAAGFAVLLCDSAISYFSRNVFGLFPINIDVPIILLLTTIVWSYQAYIPPAKSLLFLAIMTIGFLVGIYNLSEIDSANFNFVRVIPLASAIAGFLLGFMSLRWHSSENTYVKTFIFVGVVYTSICLIALFGLFPRYFPIINSLWSDNGILRSRPEITTDQNFQIFYLVPGILLLTLPSKFIRTALATIFTIAAFYVISQLQTRSGFLTLLGMVLLCTLAPIYTPSLGRNKVFMIPILGTLLVLWNLDTIINTAQLLFERIIGAENDMSNEYGTAVGRIESFLYLFEHITDPSWWFIPKGYNEFFQRYNSIPHSNITALFLEAGIPGLVGWFALIFIPLINLSIHFFKKNLDNLATVILIGGVTVLIVQLSLNVPLMDQIWLWAGAVYGTLERINEGNIDNIEIAESID